MTGGTVIKVNLDELQSVRDRERQTDKPQQLRESFYEDVGSFVEQLRAERDRAAERHNSPYAEEVMRLTDEIDAAKQLVEDIHERRIGKVVKAASLEAADLSPEVEGLTLEERDLFNRLVGDIERHRQDVLDVVDGEQSEPSESPTGETVAAQTPASDRSEVTAADVMGPEAQTGEASPRSGAGEPPESDDSGGPTEQDQTTDHPPPTEAGERHSTDGGQSTPSGTAGDDGHARPEDETTGRSPDDGDGSDSQSHGGRQSDSDSPLEGDSEGATPAGSRDIDRERVLVTEDIATFVGSDDRDYDLVADDVVKLPSTNAEILIKRDAARRL